MTKFKKGNTYGFKKGNAPLNTDKHLSEETRRKISESNKGRKVWNTGLHYKTHPRSDETKNNISKSLMGENNGSWKGGVTPQNKRLRCSKKWKIWREEVFKRDNWTCQICNIRGSVELHPHHIKPFADYPEFRFDINNGVTLCINCHLAFHRIMRYIDKVNNVNQLTYCT